MKRLWIGVDVYAVDAADQTPSCCNPAKFARQMLGPMIAHPTFLANQLGLARKRYVKQWKKDGNKGEPPLGSAFRTRFMGRTAVVVGGPAGAKAYLTIENVERGTDGSNFDQFRDVTTTSMSANSAETIVYNENMGILQIARQCDSAMPWFLIAGQPRIFPVLDNAAHKGRKEALMNVLTPDVIDKIHLPAVRSASQLMVQRIVEKIKTHEQCEIVLAEEVGLTSFNAVCRYVFGRVLPEKEEHTAHLRSAIDDFLDAVTHAAGSTPVQRARKATLLWLKFLRDQLLEMKRDKTVTPDCMMSLLMQQREDASRFALSDEAIINECFHAMFVSVGGYRCWVVNLVCELLRHPEAMEEVQKEAIGFADNERTTISSDAGDSTDFAYLRSNCPNTVLCVHETKRLHRCVNVVNFGRARKDFEVCGKQVFKNEKVVFAMYSTNTDPAVWGEDALEWNAKRSAWWKKDCPHDERDKASSTMCMGSSTDLAGNYSGPFEEPMNFAFCPHGAGDRFGSETRRRCPAEQLSTLTIAMLTLKFVAEFGRCVRFAEEDQTETYYTREHFHGSTAHALPLPPDGVRLKFTGKV